MNKYFVLAVVFLFWFVVPFALFFVGIYSFDKQDITELTGIEEISISNSLFIAWNWLGFFFRVLTFSLPDAPLVMKLVLFSFIPMTVLAFISVVRGD